LWEIPGGIGSIVSDEKELGTIEVPAL